MLTEEQRQTVTEFNRLINMTPDAMTAHYATPHSDFASIPPLVARKLGKISGKTLGKEALGLKTKAQETWTDADYVKARECANGVKRFLGRRAKLRTAEGALTPFAILLLNRGCDAEKLAPVMAPPVAPAPPSVSAVSESEMSLEDLRSEMRKAIREMFEAMLGGDIPDGMGWPWVRDIFPISRYAIVEWDDSLFRISYTFEGNILTLDAAITEVTIEYVPVIEEVGALTEVTPITEADAAAGTVPKWIGFMIKAGAAKNRAANGEPRIYTEEALKVAVAEGLFDNVPGYYVTDTEHGAGVQKTACGTWGKAVWDATAKAVRNTFTWVAEAYPKLIDARVRKAVAEGKTDEIPGFSIQGSVYPDPQKPNVIAKIATIDSCDPVSYPSAGGKVVAVTESHTQEKNQMKFSDYLKKLGLKVPPKLERVFEAQTISADPVKEAEEAAAAMIAYLEKQGGKAFSDAMKAFLAKNQADLVGMFMASIGAEEAGDPETPPADPAAATATEASKELAARVKYVEGLMLDGALAASDLDEKSRTMVRDQLVGKPFDAVKVQEAITSMKDFKSDIINGSRPKHMQVVKDGADKVREAWGDFFFHDVRDGARRQAVRESVEGASISAAAPRRIVGLHTLAELELGRPVNWMDPEDVREAMDSVVSSGNLVDGSNLRMAYSWEFASEYDDWMKVANVVTTSDTKTKNALVFGSLSGWAAKHATTGYGLLTSSGAKKESYTPTAEGGIIRISLDDFINDSVGFVQQLPDELIKMSKEAQSYFYWVSLIAANPTMASDSVTFFNASRGNVINLALDVTGLTEGVRAMITMVTPGTTTRKLTGVPKYIGISLDPAQQIAAHNLITPGFAQANATQTWLQKQAMETVTNPHTADFNDWLLFRSNKSAIAEIGFYGGRQIPTVTTANDPGTGRRFTHDEIEMKGDIRYSGTLLAPESTLWSQNAG